MMYFDHSATTPIDPSILAAMQAVAEASFGNPSSIHQAGQQARALVEKSRRLWARNLGCRPSEIIFTGSGTEANNMVLWNQLQAAKKHVISSRIEHPAVLEVLKRLESLGVPSTLVPVDATGRVDPEDIRQAIRSDTGLISIMLANNEIGTLQPVAEIARLAHEHGIRLHSDAVQAPGKIPLQCRDLEADLLSFSIHKMYGPKGVGVLYRRQGTELKPLLLGGGQEQNLRAGTENVIGITAAGLAMELVGRNGDRMTRHLRDLEELFKTQLRALLPEVRFHGHPEQHLPGLISLVLPGVASDIAVISLDMAGMAVSSGAACSSGTIKPSHVLKACGISGDDNRCTIRISFGKDNTAREVEALCRQLETLVRRRAR